MKSAFVCLLALSLFSCTQKKAFKGGVSTGQDSKIAPAPAQTPTPSTVIDENTMKPSTPAGPALPKLVEKVQDFEIQKMNSGQVDMFWVIDNSSSMSEEAALVRANLEKFMKSISDRVDIKVTVISNLGTKYSVQLSPEAVAAGHKQIVHEVASNDPLNVLMASLCPDDTKLALTTLEVNQFAQSNPPKTVAGKIPEYEKSPYTYCGVKALYYPEFYNSYIIANKSLIGSAKDRLRMAASKVFVFVTDDDALSSINQDNFSKALKLDPMSVHVYGFVGIAKTCSIAKIGAAYKALADATGGELFDICEKDWTKSFSKLSENVVKVAGTSFMIDVKANLKIKKVAVDGVEVPAGGYSFENGVLRIADANSLTNATKITVEYSYEDVSTP